jgi:HK97 family phage major capsid protein
MNLREILARRDAIRVEMRSIHDAHPDGLPDAAQTRWTALEAEVASLGATEARVAAIDALDRRSAGQPVGGSGDARFDAEIRSFSLLRAIGSQVPGMHVDAGREIETSQEVARRAGRPFQGIAVPMAIFERRVLTTGLPSGGPGSNLIQTTLAADQYIDRLRAALVVRRMGARIISGLIGGLDIPRLKADATGGWVAENSALSFSDGQFDHVSLRPSHAGCISEVSRQMLLQSSPDVEQLLRDDFAAVLAQTLDQAAINGTGSGQPRGILNTSGVGSVAMGTNGGALTFDSMADLIGSVADQNAEFGNMGLVTNTKVRRAAAKLKDSQSRPYGTEVVFQGVPTAFSNNVPAGLSKGTSAGICSAAIYGNWGDLIIGMWSELDLLVNPFETTAYSKGNVQIRGMMTVDIQVRHPESFGAIQDILA